MDLERYSGLWYQVARYPNSFQRKECRLSTARYTLREDGRVEVRDETNSWLRVRFFRIFGADYLIIDLDTDYRWAVVTTNLSPFVCIEHLGCVKPYRHPGQERVHSRGG